MPVTAYGAQMYVKPMYSKSKKNDYSDIIGTMPSITEEQQAVNTPLSDYLAEALASVGNQPTFEEWSKTNVPPMFGGELGGQAQSAYSQALSGAFPMDYYTQSIYNPALAEWNQDIMPAIKESYVGTGAITGTEVGNRLASEGQKLQANLNSVKAQLGYQAQQTATQASQAYQQAWQQQLTIAYDNYVKLNPDTSTILQAALSYLNIPLMGVYQKPETQIKNKKVSGDFGTVGYGVLMRGGQ